MKIHKGDLVTVTAGKERGKRGRVRQALPQEERVVVEGVNFIKKHRRPRSEMDQGGIIEFEAPLHVSNVMLICPHCKKPVRVGYAFLPDGEKVRVCRSCDEVVD